MKIQNNLRYIDKNFARGDYILSPVKLYGMKKKGITQIIDLRRENKFKKGIEKLFCKILNIEYVNRPLSFKSNEFPSKTFFGNINKLICENKGTTYLHCKKGKHRTGLCVAAYEKEVLHKTNPEIIYNLYTNSFSDLVKNGKKRKSLNDAITKFAKCFDLR